MENVAAIVFDCFLIADRLVIRAGHGEFAAKSIAHGIVVCRLNERIEALVIQFGIAYGIARLIQLLAVRGHPTEEGRIL